MAVALHFEAVRIVDVQIGTVALATANAVATTATADRVGVGAPAAAGAQTAPIAAITASVIW